MLDFIMDKVKDVVVQNLLFGSSRELKIRRSKNKKNIIYGDYRKLKFLSLAFNKKFNEFFADEFEKKFRTIEKAFVTNRFFNSLTSCLKYRHQQYGEFLKAYDEVKGANSLKIETNAQFFIRLFFYNPSGNYLNAGTKVITNRSFRASIRPCVDKIKNFLDKRREINTWDRVFYDIHYDLNIEPLLCFSNLLSSNLKNKIGKKIRYSVCDRALELDIEKLFSRNLSFYCLSNFIKINEEKLILDNCDLGSYQFYKNLIKSIPYYLALLPLNNFDYNFLNLNNLNIIGSINLPNQLSLLEKFLKNKKFKISKTYFFHGYSSARIERLPKDVDFINLVENKPYRIILGGNKIVYKSIKDMINSFSLLFNKNNSDNSIYKKTNIHCLQCGNPIQNFEFVNLFVNTTNSFVNLLKLQILLYKKLNVSLREELLQTIKFLFNIFRNFIVDVLKEFNIPEDIIDVFKKENNNIDYFINYTTTDVVGELLNKLESNKIERFAVNGFNAIPIKELENPQYQIRVVYHNYNGTGFFKILFNLLKICKKMLESKLQNMIIDEKISIDEAKKIEYTIVEKLLKCIDKLPGYSSLNPFNEDDAKILSCLYKNLENYIFLSSSDTSPTVFNIKETLLCNKRNLNLYTRNIYKKARKILKRRGGEIKLDINLVEN